MPTAAELNEGLKSSRHGGGGGGKVVVVAAAALLIFFGEHVEEDAGAHPRRQVDGIVTPCCQQPEDLQKVEGVERRRHGLPARPPHVQRGDDRPRDVAGEEEEEGDVAHREVNARAQKLLLEIDHHHHPNNPIDKCRKKEKAQLGLLLLPGEGGAVWSSRGFPGR